MNKRLAGILTTGALLAMSGCASMSGDECLTSDWHAIGYEDGSRGYDSSRLGDHRKACAKHGVTPDLQAYKKGRRQGLREFCQPSRGFNLGAGGGRYNGVCPASHEPAFLDAYNSGYHLHNLRSNVNAATHQINARKGELEKLEDELKANEAALIAAETTTQDRILILAEIKDISERTGELETEIYALIEDRAVMEQELASYEAVLADSGY